MNNRAQHTVVIGLGNPLMGDDGFGIAVLDRLRDEWELPEQVHLIDGGTWGMSLLPEIEDATHVLFIDAIDFGVAPGTDLLLERDQLPRYVAAKLSPHQIDMRDVLALAALRGTLPDEAVAIGVQPESVELRTSLSPRLAALLDGVVFRVVARLEHWGYRCRVRRPVYA